MGYFSVFGVGIVLPDVEIILEHRSGGDEIDHFRGIPTTTAKFHLHFR